MIFKTTSEGGQGQICGSKGESNTFEKYHALDFDYDLSRVRATPSG